MRLAWQHTWRAWRAGELRVIWLALVLSVTAITSVGFVTDRVERAMWAQMSEVLAADLVVSSQRPLAPHWAAQARRMGLKLAETMEFPSMLSTTDGLQMVQVKAVSADYPLRGALRLVARQGEAAGRDLLPGTVWLEQGLGKRLGLAAGDGLQLGERQLAVAGELQDEPDRASVWFSVAPRLMMRQQDVRSTGLVQPGSRVGYRLLVAGDATAIARYSEWAKATLTVSERLLTPQDSREELGQALNRATRFLTLAGLLTVLLACVALAIASRRYATRQMNNVALMRCLGASRGQLAQRYLVQLCLLWLGAALVGSLLGLIAQHGLAVLLAGLFQTPLPAPGWRPLGYALVVSGLSLAGFALPYLWRLPQVPPLRVLRQELLPPALSSALLLGVMLLALAGLLWWAVSDWQLVAMVLVSLGLTLGMLYVVARGMLWLLQPLRARVGVAWRFGLANVVRRERLSLLQIVGFGLGLMLLLLLTVVRTDLMEVWRGGIPQDAPNHFVINVQPDQVAALGGFLNQRLPRPAQFYPMVRSRLTAINNIPTTALEYDNPRAQRLLLHEFNLSWAQALLPHNRVVAGQWWRGRAVQELSVEQGLAETLGIQLGDQLSFQVEGRPIQARVTSFRTVDWDSFQPNFFVIASPALLAHSHAAYISSFYLPNGADGLLRELARTFPNVTVIDVAALMARVRDMIERSSRALETVFLFSLLAGLLVIYAAIESTHEERLRETALLRALGAGNQALRRGLISEFLLLGLLSGALAGLMASAAGYGLAQFVFELDYSPNLWLPLIGMVLGGALISLFGYFGVRRTLRVPPRTVLGG